MPTLFVLQKALSPNGGINRAAKLAKSGDGLVLLQDAVLALRSPIAQGTIEKVRRNGVSVYALKPDMEARGVQESANVSAIDYDDLVELIVHFERTFS